MRAIRVHELGLYSDCVCKVPLEGWQVGQEMKIISSNICNNPRKVLEFWAYGPQNRVRECSPVGCRICQHCSIEFVLFV